MTYQELRQKHEKEVNDFPFFFAFSDEQFVEGMAKFGLTINDTDKILKISHTGGFCLRTDADRFHEMFEQHEKELKEAIDADPTGEGFILEMFDYELADHEYIVSGCVSSTLDALGLTEDDIEKDHRLQHGLKLAKQRQREKYAAEGE